MVLEYTTGAMWVSGKDFLALETIKQVSWPTVL